MPRLTIVIVSLAIISGCNTKSLSELCESACEQSTDYGAECLGLTADTGGATSEPPSGVDAEIYDTASCVATCNQSADIATDAGCKDQARDLLTCVDKVDWENRECTELLSPVCEPEAAALDACMEATGGGGSSLDDCDAYAAYVCTCDDMTVSSQCDMVLEYAEAAKGDAEAQDMCAEQLEVHSSTCSQWSPR